MQIRPYLDVLPTLGARVYIDPAAVVIGKVTLGDDVSIWPTAVVRGDVDTIEIGARTSIQDGAVLHVSHDGPYKPGGRNLIIGADVTVGHKAVLHACTIGNACLVGIGAIVLDDVVTEDFVMIGAGALVTSGQQLKKGGLYLGSPARRARELSAREMQFLSYSAAHYVKLKDRYLESTPRSAI